MRSLPTTGFALLCAAGLITTTAGAAEAATSYSAKSSVNVSGTTVTATTTLSASPTTVAEVAGVCARDAQGRNVDFGKWRNVRLTTSGTKITADQKLSAGTYSYFSCVYAGGQWHNVGATKTFTVPSSSTATPTPAPTPAPTATPTPTPTPTPTQTSGGTSMPSGTSPGWQQVYAEDFTEDAPVGSFRSTYPELGDYGDATPDTSKNGCYNNGANVSAHDGMADIHLRTVNGCPSGGVLVPNNWGAQTYGKYSVRYRADAANGYGSAFLLWPASNDWAEGEIDFPESPFNAKQYMVTFKVGSPGTVAYKNYSDASWQDWHVATTEWTPGLIVFKIDGKEVGRTTQGVPTTPFRWVIQAATDGASKPSADVQGHLLIDWMVQSKRA